MQEAKEKKRKGENNFRLVQIHLQNNKFKFNQISIRQKRLTTFIIRNNL